MNNHISQNMTDDTATYPLEENLAKPQTPSTHKPANKPHKTIVWIISDGIAGHYNQSKGVLSALKHMDNTVDAYWIELKLRGGWLRLILAMLLNWFGTRIALKYLSLFYKPVDLPSNVPDFVVGTGGKISFAVVWLAGYYRAKSIFCGSKRRLKASLFSAIITVEPETAAQYIVLETYPTHIVAQRTGHNFKQTTSDGLPLWVLLIGGDRNGITYTHADWNMLANQANAIAKHQNIRWLITSSRRTGFEAEQILASLIEPDLIEDVAWMSNDDRPVVQDYLNRANVVVCTADSHSMLTESIVAQRKVMAIHPNQFEPDSEYKGMLLRYAQKGRIKLINIRELATQATNVSDIMPLAADATVLLANALAHHLHLSVMSSAASNRVDHWGSGDTASHADSPPSERIER